MCQYWWDHKKSSVLLDQLSPIKFDLHIIIVPHTSDGSDPREMLVPMATNRLSMELKYAYPVIMH